MADKEKDPAPNDPAIPEDATETITVRVSSKKLAAIKRVAASQDQSVEGYVSAALDHNLGTRGVIL